jgi:hypothetical protein
MKMLLNTDNTIHVISKQNYVLASKEENVFIPLQVQQSAFTNIGSRLPTVCMAVRLTSSEGKTDPFDRGERILLDKSFMDHRDKPVWGASGLCTFSAEQRVELHGN